MSGPSKAALRLPIETFVLVSIRLYREGITEALKQDRRFLLVGSAAAFDAAERQMAALSGRPHVALVDVGISGGTRTVRALRKASPETSIVVLAVSEVEDDVVTWVEAGASGLVSRDATSAELLDAAAAAAQDEVLTTPAVTAALLRRVAAIAGERPGGDTRRLTPREREIVNLIDDGCSNKEIARLLRIEPATVKNHVHNILEKLCVARRAEAVKAARARGEFDKV